MISAGITIPSPHLPAGPRSALVVATTTYQDPLLGKLRAPATDAVELADVLAAPEIGGFEVTTVIDRSVHEVRVALESFLADRRPEDLIVVYLSCHGVTDARRRLYFAASDTVRSRLASTGVEAQWVNELMEDCRARRQILILDCCFSGAFARGTKGDTSSTGLDQMAHPGRGRAVLTASNDREYSFEATASTQASPQGPSPGSVFTNALITGLRDGSADADGDGFISVDEAYDFAYQQVRASGVAQTPQRWLSAGEGELLLARNPAGRRITPAVLPEALRVALDNPTPAVRQGAVNALIEWLMSDDPQMVLTATKELQTVADNDIPRVAAIARAALAALSPTDTASTDIRFHESPPAPAPATATRRVARHPLPTPTEGPKEIAYLLSGSTGLLFPPVTAVAFSADGLLLACGSEDGTVRQWNPRTGELLRTWTEPVNVKCIAFSPDKRILATGGWDNAVRLWQPETGARVRILTGHSGYVTSVAFSPDSRILASGSKDNTVALWNPDTGALIRTLNHLHPLTTVLFSPDGRSLASGSDDRMVRLWDYQTGALIRTLIGHKRRVLGVALSPDNRILASSSVDKTIRLWNVQTGTLIRTLIGHLHHVTGVAFSADNRLLASSSLDKTVRLWSAQTGAPIRTLAHPKAVNCVTFSPDSRLLASGGGARSLWIWR